MSSRLQLHLSARDLKNISGLIGLSDPFAVVTVLGDSENNEPRVVGQTDVYVFPLLWNSLFVAVECVYVASWSSVRRAGKKRFSPSAYYILGHPLLT